MARKAPKGGSALTHIDASGEARMVDVSAKAATERTAVAEGRVVMGKATLDLIVSGNAKKGDVLGAARIAGIMAAKRTSELIPLCHPLALSKVTLDITPDKKLPGCIVRATVKVTGPTGVEMEALTAVSVACLTIYDMIKAVERGVRIEGIHLVEKIGGKSGHYRAERLSSATGVAVVTRGCGRFHLRTMLPYGCRRNPLPPANASLTRLANVNSISARYRSHGPGVGRTPLPEVHFSAAIAFNGIDRHHLIQDCVRLPRRPDPLVDPGRHAPDRRHRHRRDHHGRQFPRARAAQQRTRAGKHRAAAGPPFRPAARRLPGRAEGPDRVHAFQRDRDRRELQAPDVRP